MKNFIAYYRVSTAKQGESGLGLEAQEVAVAGYLSTHDAELVGSFTEVESGTRKTRPELTAAMLACKKQRAGLIIAKLDRLARNAAFLLSIIESSVPVVFCDMPDIPDGAIGKFMITQMAAVAELEAGLISQRTKVALARAKARGVVLGASGKALAEKNKAGASEFAEKLRGTVERLQSQGATTIEKLAAAMNAEGIATARGGRWHATTVHRLLARLG